jgi:hypothetical protein
MAQIHTSLPGIVTAYNQSEGTVSVQIAVKDGEEEIPPIEDVPWQAFEAGGTFVRIGASKGDEVLLVFQELDPSQFKATGVASPPNLMRRHGYHAVAIPFKQSDKKRGPFPAAGTIEVGAGVTKIVVNENEIQLGAGATDLAVLATALKTALTAAIVAGIAGVVPADGGAAALAAMNVNIAAAWPLAIQSTKVKAL